MVGSFIMVSSANIAGAWRNLLSFIPTNASPFRKERPDWHTQSLICQSVILEDFLCTGEDLFHKVMYTKSH